MPLTEEKLVTALKGKYNSGEITKVQFAQALKKFRSQQTPQQAPAQPRVDKWGVEMPENFMTELPELPPAPTLSQRMSDVWSGVKELVTGEQRSTPEVEAATDVWNMPLGPNDELATWVKAFKTGIGGLATGPEETADIFVANLGEGAYKETDRKGNWWVYNPYTKQKHPIKPGLRATDVPRIAGVMGQDLALTKGMGMLGGLGRLGQQIRKVPSVLRAGAEEAALEGTRQLVEEGVGGEEATLGDVGLAGTLGAGMKLAGKTAEAAIKEYGYPKLMASAEKGNDDAVKLLNKLKKSDPVGYRIALDSVDVKDIGFGGDVQFLDERLKDLIVEMSHSGNPDYQRLAGNIKKNPELIEFLQDNDMTDLVTVRELIDPKDYEARAQFDSAEREVLGPQLHQKIDEITPKVEELFEDMGANKDIGMVSEKMRNVMTKNRDNLESSTNRVYDRIRAAIPADAKGDASETMDYLTRRARRLGAGDLKEGLKLMSGLERKVYNALKREPGKIVDKTKPPKERPVMELRTGQPVRYRGDIVLGVEPETRVQQTIVRGREPAKPDPTYHQIDELRQMIGAQMKDVAFGDKDSFARKKLYGTLANDADRSLRNMEGVSEDLLALSGAGKKLVKRRKNLETNMHSLFGKAITDDLVKDLDSALTEGKKSGVSKFAKLIGSIPKRYRREFTVSSLLHAIPKDYDRLDMNKFASFFSKLKDNSRLNTALRANLPPQTAKTIDGIGELANAIARSTNEKLKIPNRTPGDIRAMVERKTGFIRGLFNALSGYFGGAGTIAVTGASGTGATPLALATGSVIRRSVEGAKDLDFQNAMTILESPELKAAMLGEFGDREIKELSASQVMKRFFKQLGQSDKTDDIERFIRSSMRAKGIQGETQENE